MWNVTATAGIWCFVYLMRMNNVFLQGGLPLHPTHTNFTVIWTPTSFYLTTFPFSSGCQTVNGLVLRFVKWAHTPWISMSHACFSHKVIQLLTPDLIVSYLDNHQDMQIALYALVERELFDGSFSDMIKFSEIGSIYSERIGNKLEKPSKCTDNLFHPGGTAPPLSSIHLSSCKGRREYQHECLQKIRQFDTSGSFRNWKFYNVADYTALAGSAKRSMGGWINHRGGEWGP